MREGTNEKNVVRYRPSKFRRQEKEAYHRAGQHRWDGAEARELVPDHVDDADCNGCDECDGEHRNRDQQSTT